MNINRMIHRYLFATFGAFLAMFVFIFFNFPMEGWLNTQRWSTALGLGLTFGHLYGFTILFASEIPSRLERLPLVAKLILGLVGGLAFGSLPWLAYHVLFLNSTLPASLVGIGAFALILGQLMGLIWQKGNPILRSLSLTLISTLALFLPIWYFKVQWLNGLGTDTFNPALLYFDVSKSAIFWFTGIAFSVLIAAFAHIPTLWLHSDSRDSQKQKRKNEDVLADKSERLVTQDNAQTDENPFRLAEDKSENKRQS